MKAHLKREQRQKRHRRVRRSVNGTTSRPRFCVFRSNTYIYAQIINDETGHTLVSASSLEPTVKKAVKSVKDASAAREVGTTIARRAKDAGISTVAFDRGGYLYHGRVRALAEAAREGGLEF